MAYKGYFSASRDFNVEIFHDIAGSSRVIESDVYEFDLTFLDCCQVASFRASHIQSGGLINDGEDGDRGLLRSSYARDIGSLSTQAHVCKEKQISAFEYLCWIDFEFFDKNDYSQEKH